MRESVGVLRRGEGGVDLAEAEKAHKRRERTSEESKTGCLLASACLHRVPPTRSIT